MGSEAKARLGLAALLLVTLFGFGQLFDGGDFAGPGVLAIIFGLGIAVIGRRVGLNGLFTILLSGGGLVWYLSLVFASRATLFGLPTPAAFEAVTNSVARAYAHVPTDFAPVPLRQGYVILVVAGLWAAATIGEIAGSRWRRPLLATLPVIALYSVAMVVGTGAGASLLTLLFVAALVTYWGFEAAHRLRTWGRAIPIWKHHRAEPPAITGGIAAKMGAASLAAAIIGPLLMPAVGSGSWLWDAGDGLGLGSGAGRSVSPLVSIKPRLLDQTTEVLFEVRAAEPAYWRLASLDHFDGTNWSLDLGPVGTASDGPVPDRYITRTRPLVQTFTITALEGTLVPAAVQAELTQAAIQVTESGDPARDGDDFLYQQGAGSLQIEGGLTPNLQYEVRSHRPSVSYVTLLGARLGDPGDQYRQLPDNLSPQITRIARRWTIEENTVHQKLVALQERLRAFNYSLDVEDRATSDYLLQFLTETREGYCQQFATAFAVLARTLGIPTRVSVGFLPGEQDPGDPERFVVRGNHAHAWPEVYFEGIGWVAYEPTPRGISSPRDYTFPPLTDPAISGAAGVREGGGLATGGDPRRLTQRERASLSEGALQAVRAPAQRETPIWERAFARLRAILLALVIAALVFIPLAKQMRAARRYHRARDPVGTATAAFAAFADEAAWLASARAPSESATAYALRLAEINRVPRRAALALAAIYDAAEYGPSGVSDRQARDARRLAADLRARLWNTASWWERASRVFSPRGLLSRG